MRRRDLIKGIAGSAAALGVLVMVAVIMGWRLLDPFKSFIEQLAAASPEAPMDVTWLFVVLLGAAYLFIAYYCRGGGYGGTVDWLLGIKPGRVRRLLLR